MGIDACLKIQCVGWYWIFHFGGMWSESVLGCQLSVVEVCGPESKIVLNGLGRFVCIG